MMRQKRYIILCQYVLIMMRCFQKTFEYNLYCSGLAESIIYISTEINWKIFYTLKTWRQIQQHQNNSKLHWRRSISICERERINQYIFYLHQKISDPPHYDFLLFMAPPPYHFSPLWSHQKNVQNNFYRNN